MLAHLITIHIARSSLLLSHSLALHAALPTTLSTAARLGVQSGRCEHNEKQTEY
jgi:hypothetical protein